MVRSLIDKLDGRRFGGVYVIQNPMFPKRYIKIGMSDVDIIHRLRTYTTAYPEDFWVVALLLYPNDYRKYLHSRDAETRLHRMFKLKRVFGYPRQKNSEWFSLSNVEQKRLLKEMKKIADETGGFFNHFGHSHVINMPI